MVTHHTAEHARSALILRAKAQVVTDALAGKFAPRAAQGKDGTIRHFSDLHDYVDANYYGGAFDEDVQRALARYVHVPPGDPDDAEADLQFGEVIQQFFGPVQEALDQWIVSGSFARVTERLRTGFGRVTADAVALVAAGVPLTDIAAMVEELE